MAQDKENLLLLFQRPGEPVFTSKDNGKVAFDIPQEYYTDHYKPIGQEIQTRLGDDVERRINIRPISQPDYSFALAVPREMPFSLFNEKHRNIAGRLIKVWMDMPDVQSLISTAAFAKDRLNPYMFQYALSVTIQHRPDTKDVNITSIVEQFPDQFMPGSVFPRLREEASVVPQGNRTPVEIPLNYTASDREEEQRLAYFREDIAVNLHHWHWHLVYPGDGPIEIVRKDRRGELFYYMHAQIIFRYNIERICNRLARVQRFNNFREPIAEGYFPKMMRSNLGRAFPPRFSNMVLQDVDRVASSVQVEISDMERWRDRIYEAIDQGFIVSTSGERIPLDETRGIDILGDIVEASILTPNRQLYGNLHAEGHNMLAYIHDPDNRYLEDYGVVGDFTTAMRDPVFYRWHAFIDYVFQRHKNRLPVYNQQQLAYDGIVVNSVNVQITRGQNPTPNVLLTFWQKSSVDLAAGLDFGPEGNMFAQFTHLQHAPFVYRISVNNDSGAQRRGTCRIFMAPRVDERGTNLSFAEQRLLMIELDKFTVNLRPGENTIVRRSDESSVTIPYERSLRAVGKANQPTDPNALAAFQFCGCGWPQHLLIPKGTPEGTIFDLFVMVSNYADDTVNQDYDPNEGCNDSASFCGLRDKLYPDKRSMGYPFDRPSAPSVATLQDFIAQGSNMNRNQVQIRFTNTLVNRN